jgi:hypothetical protein
MPGNKAEVVIGGKGHEALKEALEETLKRLEKKVEPPPIEDTLGKVEQALAQAQKAKHKPVKQTWYCTDCGRAHVQNDGAGMGLGHIDVDCLDGEFVDKSGNPLTGKPLKLMERYAVPKTDSGNADHGLSHNKQVLAKMRELKAGAK